MAQPTPVHFGNLKAMKVFSWKIRTGMSESSPKQTRGTREEYGSRTCKPNSVRRIAPAGRSFLWATHRCEALATYPKVGRTEPARAETRFVRIKFRLPSYLVLLRVWFALPAALLPRRCALTAPFHPYPHP